MGGLLQETFKRKKAKKASRDARKKGEQGGEVLSKLKGNTGPGG